MSQQRRHPTCSFCGKGASQVDHLVAGLTNTYICSECVRLCYTIVAGPAQAEAATASTAAPRARWWRPWARRARRKGTIPGGA